MRSEPPSFIYYDDFAKNLGTLPLLNYYSNDNYQKILIAVSLGGNNLLYQDMKQNNNTQLILEPK